MSEEQDEVQGEWLRFGALAGVLLGAILVVWAVRPFIANRVVPAFLGEWGGGHEVSLPILEAAPVPGEESGAGGVEMEGETAVPSEAAPAEANESGSGAETAVEPYPAPTVEAAASQPPAVVSDVVHVVQQGETLFGIAQQYRVTVEQLTAANNITNPNQIHIGDTLKIPQP